MATARNHIAMVVEALLTAQATTATKYVSPKHIIRATRPLHRGRFLKGNTTIVLTIGRPNFAERRFIAHCKKAGEPFPIKKVLLRFAPSKAMAVIK